MNALERWATVNELLDLLTLEKKIESRNAKKNTSNLSNIHQNPDAAELIKAVECRQKRINILQNIGYQLELIIEMMNHREFEPSYELLIFNDSLLDLILYEETIDQLSIEN